MQTHTKKRIEILIEAPAVRRIEAQLDHPAVSGYTIMPVIGGRGRDGHWSADGQIGTAGQMAVFICIVDAAHADAALEAIFAVVSHQIGLVSVSDVEVLRPDRF